MQPNQSNGATSAPASPAVQPECALAADDQDIPLDSTIEAKVTGLLDSAHLKPGKEITAQVVAEWQFPGCNLPAKSNSLRPRNRKQFVQKSDASEMAELVFDHGENVTVAFEKASSISLTVIGIVAPPDQYVGLHSALPSEVAGQRSRYIQFCGQWRGSRRTKI